MTLPLPRLIPPAAATFIASGIGFALSRGGNTAGGELLPGTLATAPLGSDDLMQILLRPGNWLLWSLTLAIWLGIGLHALAIWRGKAGHSGAEGNDTRHPSDHLTGQLTPLLGALIAGTIWPWSTHAHPLIALLVAGSMAGLALAAVIRSGLARQGASGRDSMALAGFAGWATVAACAALAGWLSGGIGLPARPAAMLALLTGTLIGMGAQMRLGRAGSYSIAIIWAMLGIALAAMISQPPLAISAVLAMTAMSVVLVRAVS